MTRTAETSPSISLPCRIELSAAVTPSWQTRSLARSAISWPERTSITLSLGETAMSTERDASGAVADVDGEGSLGGAGRLDQRVVDREELVIGEGRLNERRARLVHAGDPAAAGEGVSVRKVGLDHRGPLRTCHLPGLRSAPGRIR